MLQEFAKEAADHKLYKVAFVSSDGAAPDEMKGNKVRVCRLSNVIATQQGNPFGRVQIRNCVSETSQRKKRVVVSLHVIIGFYVFLNFTFGGGVQG